MTIALLVLLNVALAAFFVWLLRRPNLLGYAKGGKWYLTWLSIGVITLMDELTSVFYAPAEAHRFIGHRAIFFIAFTSLLMRVLSSRMVEIAHILELNGIRGGGVYSFSYLVLGPSVSFVAVASIMVDYILTACISTVSAVINGTYIVNIGPGTEYALILGIIWGVAILNIMGIRENARVTFTIFIAAAFVFVNLIALGSVHMEPGASQRIVESAGSVIGEITHGGLVVFIQVVTIGVASCVLAYSGIESVIQTAGLVESWREIRKAYTFLALTVGIVTPLLSALALSATIDFGQHEGDLIPHYASMVSTEWFGALVGIFGSVILIMAVNTAYVASSELLERVGHRYRFDWLLSTNRRDSLYRIHIANGAMYTGIILLTAGSQAVLAEMYAIGLLASFCINVGCLIIYRWFQGSKQIAAYHTSRVGTVLLECVLVCCFVYLAFHKPYGTGLWAGVVAVILAAGIPFSRRYGPELREKRRSDYPMEMLLSLGETDGPLHVWFRRPGEGQAIDEPGHAFVTFFSPRQQIPDRQGPCHYRFPVQGSGVLASIRSILALLEEELSGRDVAVHFGWPTSSWLDRMATGVFVRNLLRLPGRYPGLKFLIEQPARPRSVGEREATATERDTGT
jgi:amino acid transporter